MSDPVALGQPTVGEAEVAAVARVLASGWLSGAGPTCEAFEQRFGRVAGTAHTVATSSCGAALHLALLALGVGPGDEVVVADYTFPATGHAVLWTGATPVFADVRPDTWSVDPAAVEAAVTARTAGILAVDPFGQPADYDELRAVADRHGLFLVEDAACAAGASYRGRPAGSLADIACFSFHGRKGITAGEGGALTTDDAGWADTARRLHTYGAAPAAAPRGPPRPADPVVRGAGFNYRLSDVQAGILLAQLDRLPTLVARRREVAQAYGELLAGWSRWSCRSRARTGCTPGSPTSSRCTRRWTATRSRSPCGPGHRMHHRHLRLAPAARLRHAEAAAGVGRPLRAAPGHPDARQPDRRGGRPASRVGCARSSRARRPCLRGRPPRRHHRTPLPAHRRRTHHGRRSHRARHRRRRVDRAAHHPPAARAWLPRADPGQHGPRRPGRGDPAGRGRRRRRRRAGRAVRRRGAPGHEGRHARDALRRGVDQQEPGRPVRVDGDQPGRQPQRLRRRRRPRRATTGVRLERVGLRRARPAADGRGRHAAPADAVLHQQAGRGRTCWGSTSGGRGCPGSRCGSSTSTGPGRRPPRTTRR